MRGTIRTVKPGVHEIAAEAGESPDCRRRLYTRFYGTKRAARCRLRDLVAQAESVSTPATQRVVRGRAGRPV